MENELVENGTSSTTNSTNDVPEIELIIKVILLWAQYIQGVFYLLYVTLRKFE